ncbi:MAG: hypothetical protein KC550_04015 [Nanoarchaeota archaeon]|nr:hypothetical protein [Nanoarchaeota archaeon]
MLKRALFVLIVFFGSILFISAADVKIKTSLNENFTEFEYEFNFTIDESYSSFSIEKPKFSEIKYVRFASDPNSTIKYSSAGDYFIFRPSDNTAGKVIELKFISKSLSATTLNSNSFSTYLNFNFPVEKLNYQLYFNNHYGDILEVFPRDYEIIEDNYYEWEIISPPKDSLFLVNFEPKSKPSDNSDYSYFLVILLIAPIILFIVLLIFIKNYFLKSGEKNEKKSSNSNNKKDLKSDLNDGESEEISKKNPKEEKLEEKTKEKIDKKTDEKIKEHIELEKKFEEIKEKYLTDNEKQIVDIIKENNGISQNDILNHLPKLTKSNLSKIISKLHSRKILNRIKVGKINKIYLGEKLETSPQKEEISS